MRTLEQARYLAETIRYLPGDDWGRDGDIIALDDEVTRLTDTTDSIRALHYEREHRPLDGIFLGGTVCNADRLSYPCSTVNILNRVVGS